MLIFGRGARKILVSVVRMANPGGDRPRGFARPWFPDGARASSSPWTGGKLTKHCSCREAEENRLTTEATQALVDDEEVVGDEIEASRQLEPGVRHPTVELFLPCSCRSSEVIDLL